MARTLTLLLLFLFSLPVLAQIPTPDGPRFGHEWIESGSNYLRVQVAEDGMYRIPAAALTAAGLPAVESEGMRFQLHHLGKPVAIDVRADGILFYGERARGELDAYLFEDPAEQQLNPEYGMYTDTASYYLSVADASGTFPRYREGQGGGGSELSVIYRTAERVFGEEDSKYYFRSGGNSVVFSRYELAEGFGSRSRNNLLSSNGSTVSSTELDLPGAVGGTGSLELRFGLAFPLTHNQRISVNGTEVGTVEATNWSLHQPVYSVNLTGDRATVRVEGTGGDQDKANLAYMRLSYPAAVGRAGAQLRFSLPIGGAASLRFSDLPSAARLYDLTNGVVYLPDNGVFRLSEAGTERQFCLLVEPKTPASSEGMVLADNLPPAGAQYLILSSRRLAGSELDEMAAYRSSPAGGGYLVHTVYAEDLYNSHGYGLERHPRAIKNYLEAAVAAAPTLEYLFIVGKGREYPSRRTAEQLERAWPTFFVPSFGLPASDNLLTAPIGGNVPRLATGRLAAIERGEIATYLRKLREVERQVDQAGQTIAELDWMKQALFLGGGQTPGEQAQIRQNLAGMERIIERSEMGAEVTSFFRTSSEPIENSRKDAIFERINTGTSIIAFHGHSSTQGFDFSIDNPDNYENRGKYPLMLSLGCYSGDAFVADRSISERFIFLNDGGAITFAASKGLGYPSALGVYGETLMQQIGNETYGQGVGKAFQRTSAALTNNLNFPIQLLLEQFSLSGDPAFRIHPRPGPDLVIVPESVSFRPAVVPAQDSSYTISLQVLNLGSYTEDTPDSVTLRFRQKLPNGEIRALGSSQIVTPSYATPAEFELPNLGFQAIGANRILITIDAENAVAELPAPAAENNNDLVIGSLEGIPLTVVANTARAAFPPAYAVVGGEVELIANSTDPLAPQRDYIVQLATESDFAEPLVDETITRDGGVMRFMPSLNYSDSTTYYWRISPDSASNPTIGYIWSSSSFTYIRGQEEVGFALQHPGQLADGDTDRLSVDSRSEEWNFARNVNDVELFNGVFEDSFLPRLVWNGTRFSSPHPWRVRAGIQVMVIDSTNNSNWYRYPGDNAFNSVGRASTTWNFDTRTPEGREGLMRFLDEGVEAGKYVLVWSVQRGSDIEYHTDGWAEDSIRLGQSIYDVLEAEGAEQVRLLQQLGSVPYTFAYQKGRGLLAEAIATSQDGQTSVLIPIQENSQAGFYKSMPVGPALQYRDLELRFLPYRVGPADSSHFRLIGIDDREQRTTLREQAFDLSNDLIYTFDISEIDATQYPFLVVEVDIYDEEDRTAASLEEIYLNYQRPPDVAVNTAIAYTTPDTLIQGQSSRFEVGYENISATDMDSLLIKLDVIDARNDVSTTYARQPPLPAGASGTVSFDLPSDANTELRMQLMLNPDGDQPEDQLFNNFLTDRIGVGVDRIDPDLQVYYDGRRIRDGELISSEPEILVQLRDENPFRRLDDSSAYTIVLRAPDGSEERVRMSDSRVDYLPAPADGDNLAEIYFRPELRVDGEYSLIIEATDRASNKAGRLAYEQSFEVINEQLIANVLTYPNPFSTQTSFVYTLTGNTPPEMFRIQIMTVSGRVVRDIDLLAREDIRVGTHQTEFKWDGTDEYGDQLANGVYLYRVITSDGNGAELETYDTGTDAFFQNGLGKVVILR
jgi:hypothetical protein